MTSARPDARTVAAVVFRVLVHSARQKHERRLVYGVVHEDDAKTLAPSFGARVPFGGNATYPRVPACAKYSAGSGSVTHDTFKPVMSHVWKDITGRSRRGRAAARRPTAARAAVSISAAAGIAVVLGGR